jgi:hypothetical protein
VSAATARDEEHVHGVARPHTSHPRRVRRPVQDWELTDAALLLWDWQAAPTEQQGLPNPVPIDHPLHVHNVALPYMGMPIVDNADLRPVARACADLGRCEFLLTVAPLVLEGATGSPVNPIALF